MKAIKEGDLFSIKGMDVTEMLALYTMVSEAAPQLRQSLGAFNNPDMVLAAIDAVYQNVTELMLTRTEGQAEIPFFKEGY